MGLRLKLSKTVVVPIGAQEVVFWRDHFQHLLPLVDSWHLLQVCEGARYLGYWLGHGHQELTQLLPQKLLSRFPAIKQLAVGTGHSVALASTLLFSMTRHTLAAVSPGPLLQLAWNKCINALLAGPHQWLGPLTFFTQKHLGWPSSLPSLDLWAVESKLRELARHSLDFDRLWDNIQLDRDDDLAILAYPIFSWTRDGCVNSWRAAGELGRRNHWLKLRGHSSGSVQWVFTKAWSSLRPMMKSTLLPEKSACIDFFVIKFCRRFVAEPLAAPFLTRAFSLACIAASRRLARMHGAQGAVCLSRLLLGVFHKSSHHHRGSCCFFLDFHTGFPHSVLTRGCYRRALSAFRAFTFLQHASPTVFFEFVLLHHDDVALRHLNSLARALVEVQHSCYFSLEGAFSSTTPVAFAIHRLRGRRAGQRAARHS